ncbi:transposase [Acinetobacter variabilis]
MLHKPIHRHKSLSKITSRGKSSMGRFYGYKLHVVMNQLREIVCSQ